MYVCMFGEFTRMCVCIMYCVLCIVYHVDGFVHTHVRVYHVDGFVHTACLAMCMRP